MPLSHVLTGGLGYGAPGVSLIPTRGLVPAPPAAPSVISLPADREDALSLPADAARVLPLEASLAMSAYGTIDLFRGEDKRLEFTLPDGEDATGWDVVFTVATSAGGTVKIVKTAAVTSETEFEVDLESADTADLAPGTYTWDAWDRTAGTYASLAHGPLRLRREVAVYTP